MKLFILHGWTYQTETWQPLLNLLAAQGIEYEFLRIPGLTDGTDPVWTLEDYVAWLEEKTAGHEKVILYGHSNGGRISIAYAAKHPDKVAGLILEDSAGIPVTGLRRLKRDVFKTISRAGRLFSRSDMLRRIFYKVIREGDYSGATANMKKTMANLLSVDLSLVLNRITCPTLIIWGVGDKTTPLSAGKRIHEGIKNSRMVVIDGARHSPHITHSQKIAELIKKEVASALKDCDLQPIASLLGKSGI